MSWDSLIGPLAGLVLSGVSTIGYAVWRGRMARRSLPAVRAGRRVAIPVTVESDRTVRGQAIRDGEDVRIVGARTQIVVDRADFQRSSTRRARLDDERVEVVELTGLVDAAGGRYFIGPPERWAAAFRAFLEAPAPPAGRVWRWWAAVPRSALTLAVVGLAALGVTQAMWWSGHDVTARMVEVVTVDGSDSCAVEWVDGRRHEHAELDCYEPYPALGSPVSVRALAWPFDESAMDEEGSYEGLTTLTGGLALAAIVGAASIGAVRTRRAEVRLRAALQDTLRDGPPPGREGVLDLTFRQLAAAAAAQEGWGSEPAGEPPTPRPWDSLRLAVGSARWFPAIVLTAIAWVPESLPQPWRLALSAGAGAVLLWALWRTVGTLLTIRRPFAAPLTSEWDYLLVRSIEGGWFAFLMLGDTAHWAVFLAGDLHPAASGRCGVRGDLEDGGAVHLQIGGRDWIPASPVIRVDDELRVEVREDLVHRLVGEPSGGDGPAAPHTVGP